MKKPVRRIEFESPREKADWLDSAASLDSLSSTVERLANRARRMAINETKSSTNVEYFKRLATILHRFVRDTIEYRPDEVPVNTPQGPRLKRAEALEDSEIILRRGFDDCDGKSRLFVALARAAGLEARIRPIDKGPRKFIHAQAEVRWPGSKREKLSDDDGWMLAEMILKDCELGCDPDKMPRDRLGKRILAGPR